MSKIYKYTIIYHFILFTTVALLNYINYGIDSSLGWIVCIFLLIGHTGEQIKIAKLEKQIEELKKQIK